VKFALLLFIVFAFVHHTAHCPLLLVSCMLYMVKKHCPEEASHLNGWAKCRLMIKIVRRANLSRLDLKPGGKCYEITTWVANRTAKFSHFILFEMLFCFLLHFLFRFGLFFCINMAWYDGSVTDAITASKNQAKLFVVYLHGKSI